MITTSLIFSILALSSLSWLWMYSTPTTLLREYLRLHIPFLNYPLVYELMECLTCTTFWVTFVTLYMFNYSFTIAVGSAGIASLLITILDGNIKFKQ